MERKKPAGRLPYLDELLFPIHLDDEGQGEHQSGRHNDPAHQGKTVTKEQKPSQYIEQRKHQHARVSYSDRAFSVIPKKTGSRD